MSLELIMLQIVVYRLSLLLGPCDGVGGRVKREADREVERNQKHIRNVGELFAYVKENFPNIEPILISEQEDRIHREAIQEEFDHAKAIKGSSKSIYLILEGFKKCQQELVAEFC